MQLSYLQHYFKYSKILNYKSEINFVIKISLRSDYMGQVKKIFTEQNGMFQLSWLNLKIETNIQKLFL